MVLIPKFDSRAKVKNFGLVTVAIQLNPAGTVLDLTGGDAGRLPTTFPFRLAHVATEEVIQVDSLVAGDQYNVTRIIEGGPVGGGTIPAGERLLLSLTAFMYEHMTERINRLERMYITRFQLTEGIYYDGTTDDWKVTEQGPQAMAVDVSAGFGAIIGEPVEQVSAGVVAIVAPGADKYIGAIQYTIGVGLNVKYGATDPSPSAPTPDAETLTLATILIDTADIVIADSQITQDLSGLYF